MTEILAEPPEPEGDNTVAGGGDAVENIEEEDLEDTADLDDDDE